MIHEPPPPHSQKDRAKHELLEAHPKMFLLYEFSMKKLAHCNSLTNHTYAGKFEQQMQD